MDDGVGISPTPVADMANGESLQMLVRQKHSKEGSGATNSVGNTTRGRTSLGLRPWQQPVPLPPSTLDSLVRSKSLAGSPHGAGFGEISASQEEAVLTKDKEEVGEFDMEKIIVEDEGYGSRDDRSEEKKSSFWQDLWSSPSAQLKRLVRTPWKGGIPPFWVDSNVQGTPSRGRGTPSRGRGGRGSKAKRGRGVPRGKPAKHGGLWGAISQIKRSDAAIKEFENQFLSDSSKGPKASRTTLVTGLLKKINEPKPMVPLTCRSLKALSTAFWKAGYKSAEAYLVEAKQLHVEAGHEWSQLLDFTYKKCKTGVSRNRGPRKKAPEVGAKVRKECQHRILPRKVPVWYPKELFRFAMVWMLRCIELMEVKAKDITVDATNKRITLYWYKDKKDQMAGGTTRVLACLCSSSSCDVECPYLVSVELLLKVGRFHDGNGGLCWQKKGSNRVPATKSQITKGWSMAYNMVVTGHSGRRTGALNYIRMGWAIPQVAYLGRWKSDVIYNYAQEALQCRPVNEAPILEKAIANAPPPRDESGEIIAEVKDQYVKLQVEVEEFKRDSRKAIRSLSSEVEDLAKNYGSPAETPPYVQSMASKVIHQNLTPVTCTPPILWRTRCGWQFKDGNFCFVASSLQVTCAKCLVYMDAQTQGGVNGIL